jgi:gas vesicle protein
MEARKAALGIVLGIGVGAILGVLFAPNKGSKTRKRIRDKGQGFAEDLKGKFDGLYEDVSGKYETLLNDAKNVISSK